MSKKNQNAKEFASKMTEGLDEVVDTTKETEVSDDLVAKYLDREHLENTPFEPIKELISTKYDPEREPKVQAGLEVIKELMGDKINPLIILLAKFWENKAARKAIKQLIDDEAAKKNIPADIYLQVNLRENVDKAAMLQSAIDRMRYAITYFKPRGGIGAKPIFKPMKINGIDYNVNLNDYNKAKELFGEDKEQIKNYLVERSEKIVIEEIL